MSVESSSSSTSAAFAFDEQHEFAEDGEFEFEFDGVHDAFEGGFHDVEIGEFEAQQQDVHGDDEHVDGEELPEDFARERRGLAGGFAGRGGGVDLLRGAQDAECVQDVD